MFPAGIRAAPFPAYAWLPPARLLLEPVNGSRTLYVDNNDPLTPGALSRWLLWGESRSLARNTAAFRRRFRLQ